MTIKKFTIGEHTLSVDLDNLGDLNKQFAVKNSLFAKIATDFRKLYLPSAIAHYYIQGDLASIRKIYSAAGNITGMKHFQALIKRLSCHPFNKETGDFGRHPDQKKYKAKVASMTKVDADGNPEWMKILVAYLDRELTKDKKASEKTYYESALPKLRAIINMHDKAETAEERAIFEPLIALAKQAVHQLNVIKNPTLDTTNA